MFSQGLQHFTAEAVVPEQLLHYVTAVAGSRPLACAGFPAYLLEGPDLEAAAARVKEATDAAARLEAVSVRQSAEAATAEGVQLRVDAAVDAALALPEVRQITVLAPVRPTRAPQDAGTGTPDAYWDLELPLLREDGSLPWQKLRNMERRALREEGVVRGSRITPRWCGTFCAASLSSPARCTSSAIWKAMWAPIPTCSSGPPATGRTTAFRPLPWAITPP